MKEMEDTTIYDDTANELKDGDEQRNHKGFDDSSVDTKNGIEDGNENFPNSPDNGSLPLELSDEYKDSRFEHHNPFLDDHADKNVLEYDVVRDICVDLGVREEKSDAEDPCVRNGCHKSTNPFLEEDEGEEHSTFKNTEKEIDAKDDFITSVSDECDGIDHVTPSHQKALSEEEDTNSKEEAAENHIEESISDDHSSKFHGNEDDGARENKSKVDERKSPFQPDGGETSFSRAGLVEYSGPVVAYSGSISHRSDASTTSCRSFAFPIMQPEWDSSPVRMAKADKRHYRKHNKGWRSGLLCCRF